MACTTPKNLAMMRQSRSQASPSPTPFHLANCSARLASRTTKASQTSACHWRRAPDKLFSATLVAHHCSRTTTSATH